MQMEEKIWLLGLLGGWLFVVGMLMPWRTSVFFLGLSVVVLLWMKKLVGRRRSTQ